MRRTSLITGQILILAFLFAACGVSAFAANITVNSTLDNEADGCGVGTCTLREAIAYANSHANADANTPDVITFNIPDAQKVNGIWTIQLVSALPAISDNVTITGSGANLLTVRGGGTSAFSIFAVNSGLSATFSGMTISNGDDGIYNNGNVTVTGCTFSGNDTGINNFGNVTVAGCTFSGNSFWGIKNMGGNPGTGSVTVTNSTFRDNVSFRGGISTFDGSVTVTGCTFSGNYYGIVNNGAGIVTVTNSTFSGNHYGYGNGNVTSGSMTATGCTFTGNTYGVFGGSNVTLKNTMSVGNTDTNVLGNVIDGGGNITSGTAAQAGLDPNGLQENGGPTMTIKLLPGSPAINAGSNALIPSGITTDQRGAGYARIVGGTVDIGSYEFNSMPTAASVSISGRVLTNNNRGLANAVVYLTDSSGETRAARTNPFGYYRFEDIAAGQTVIITVVSKRYQFSPQVLSVTEAIENLNIAALAPLREK